MTTTQSTSFVNISSQSSGYIINQQKHQIEMLLYTGKTSNSSTIFSFFFHTNWRSCFRGRACTFRLGMSHIMPIKPWQRCGVISAMVGMVWLMPSCKVQALHLKQELQSGTNHCIRNPHLIHLWWSTTGTP